MYVRRVQVYPTHPLHMYGELPTVRDIYSGTDLFTVTDSVIVHAYLVFPRWLKLIQVDRIPRLRGNLANTVSSLRTRRLC